MKRSTVAFALKFSERQPMLIQLFACHVGNIGVEIGGMGMIRASVF